MHSETKNLPSFLGFYIQKLSLRQLIIIGILGSFAIGIFISKAIFHLENDTLSTINLYGFAFMWVGPILFFPITDDFRNIPFLSGWLVSYSLFLISAPSFNPGIFPLVTILYTQLGRMVFFLIYQKQPIGILTRYSPQYSIKRFSAIEKRMSGEKDHYFSFIMTVTGLLIAFPVLELLIRIGLNK